ncbi:MAG: UPF0182 family protein, partial [Microbacterium sp.]
SSGTQLPQLKKVLVAFGSAVAFEDTLDEALDDLFGGDSGATAGDEEVVPDTGDSTDSGDSTDTTDSTAYQEALAAAEQAMLDRDSALQSGDWTAYGEADQRLTDAVNELLSLSGDQ